MCSDQVVPHFNGSGPIHLWKFLLGLLMDKSCQNLISWTGNGWEFKFHDARQVSRRWGVLKNKPNMNYEKLARALRYYYKTGPIQKATGRKYVYRFVDNEFILNSIGMTLQDLYKRVMDNQ